MYDHPCKAHRLRFAQFLCGILKTFYKYLSGLRPNATEHNLKNMAKSHKPNRSLIHCWINVSWKRVNVWSKKNNYTIGVQFVLLNEYSLNPLRDTCDEFICWNRSKNTVPSSCLLDDRGHICGFPDDIIESRLHLWNITIQNTSCKQLFEMRKIGCPIHGFRCIFLDLYLKRRTKCAGQQHGWKWIIFPPSIFTL